MADEKITTEDLEASVRALLAAKVEFDAAHEAHEAARAVLEEAAVRVDSAHAALVAAKDAMDERLYQPSAASVRAETA